MNLLVAVLVHYTPSYVFSYYADLVLSDMRIYVPRLYGHMVIFLKAQRFNRELMN
jgi:hypothetical protein